MAWLKIRLLVVTTSGPTYLGAVQNSPRLERCKAIGYGHVCLAIESTTVALCGSHLAYLAAHSFNHQALFRVERQFPPYLRSSPPLWKHHSRPLPKTRNSITHTPEALKTASVNLSSKRVRNKASYTWAWRGLPAEWTTIRRISATP